jgi:hypothetical protein
MRFTLRTRLIFAFLAVSVVSVGFTGVLVDITVRRLSLEQVEDRLRYEVTMTGQMTASALFGPLSPDDASLQGPLTDLSRAVETQLSVLSPDGVVVANSEQPDAHLRSLESPGPEVAQARMLGKASAIRGQGAERRLWVAESVVRDGQLLGIARASIPMSLIDDHARAVRKRVYMAAMGALFLSSLIALGLSVGIAADSPPRPGASATVIWKRA